MTTVSQAVETRAIAARRHRLAAFLIDTIIFYGATSPFYLFGEPAETSDESLLDTLLNPYAGDPDWPIAVVFTVLLTAYYWVQHALWGQTVGKRLCRLKVVAGATGQSPSPRQAGIRALIYPALTWAPYLGVVLTLVDLLWIFGDPKRRCLHDVVAGTVVVDLRGPEGTKFAGSGFRLGLGILLTFCAAFVIISLLMAR